MVDTHNSFDRYFLFFHSPPHWFLSKLPIQGNKNSYYMYHNMIAFNDYFDPEVIVWVFVVMCYFMYPTRWQSS